MVLTMFIILMTFIKLIAKHTENWIDNATFPLVTISSVKVVDEF